jgi:hypothetical protein
MTDVQVEAALDAFMMRWAVESMCPAGTVGAMHSILETAPAAFRRAIRDALTAAREADPWALPVELLPRYWQVDEISSKRGPPNSKRTGWVCILEGPDDAWIYETGVMRKGEGPTPRAAFLAAVEAAKS